MQGGRIDARPGDDVRPGTSETKLRTAAPRGRTHARLKNII